MLIKVKTKNGIHILCKSDRPIIGKHHSTKPKAYSDGRNGDYWETYPQMTRDGAKLQKSLLSNPLPSPIMVFDLIVQKGFMRSDNVQN